MRWFRWWLANAGTVFALAVLPAAFAVTWTHDEKSLPAVLVAVLVNLLFVASAMQGLRNLWRRSPARAALLGLVVPLFLVLVLLNGGARADPWALVLFVPALLALATEGLARRFGWALPEVSAGDPAVAAGRRKLGCVVGSVMVFVVFSAYCVTSFHAPVWNAEAFKKRLRPGMSVGEAVAAAAGTGPHLVFVDAEEGGPELHIGETGASLGSERAEGAAAVRLLLDRHVRELRLRSLRFVYLTNIPARSTILVTFGPDGRVTAIEGPFSRAD